MPPVICDSEDEEEVLVEEHEPSQQSHSSNRDFDQAATLALHILSGSQGPAQADGSSLSTGELNRQIAYTTRGLFSSETKRSEMAGPSAPSSQQGLSRRHMSINAETTPASSAKIKRTSTTYGKGNSKAQWPPQSGLDEAFEAFCNDERASQESLSAGFLYPSAKQKSGEILSGGTLVRNFQDHDPHTLFPDSGTTIANNESSVQRLLDQARNPLQSAESPAQTRDNDSQPQQSSGFAAWSVSEQQTQTPNLRPGSGSSLQRGTPVGAGEKATVSHDPGESQDSDHRDSEIDSALNAQTYQSGTAHGSVDNLKAFKPVPQAKLQVQIEPQNPASLKGHVVKQDTVPPKSSPMVIIPAVQEAQTATLRMETKTSRCRKRKSVDNDPCEDLAGGSDALNSDDRAVGLPKEMYQPRPSRRRATSIEEPSDFCVISEKAAKKRRKTLDAEQVNLLQASQSNAKSKAKASRGDVTTYEKPSSSRRTTRRDADADLNTAIANSLRDMEQAANDQSTVMPDQQSQANAPRQMLTDPLRPAASPLSSPERVKNKSSSQKAAAAGSQQSQASSLKMLPPSLPASATRKTPRRSQTTIFEDHTPQRSRSLSQQQADRLAAVQDVLPPSQSKKRKRRTIVQDDVDDEEDELAMESPAAKPLPKKRGRPSKADVAARGSAAEGVPSGPDDETAIQGLLGTAARMSEIQQGPSKESEKEGREDVVEPKKGSRFKPAARVLEDSEDELDLQYNDHAAPETTSNRPRGRPRKADKTLNDSEAAPDNDANDSASFQPKKTIKDAGDVQATKKASVTKASTAEASQDSAPLQPKDANANAGTGSSTSIGETSTPAPLTERPTSEVATKHTTPAHDVKPSPNSHSPIKKNAKVIHRVGLGRRQRVQPLLKIIRPEVRARKEDATRVTTVTSVAELEKKWNTVEE